MSLLSAPVPATGWSQRLGVGRKGIGSAGSKRYSGTPVSFRFIRGSTYQSDADFSPVVETAIVILHVYFHGKAIHPIIPSFFFQVRTALALCFYNPRVDVRSFFGRGFKTAAYFFVPFANSSTFFFGQSYLLGIGVGFVLHSWEG